MRDSVLWTLAVVTLIAVAAAYRFSRCATDDAIPVGTMREGFSDGLHSGAHGVLVVVIGRVPQVEYQPGQQTFERLAQPLVVLPADVHARGVHPDLPVVAAMRVAAIRPKSLYVLLGAITVAAHRDERMPLVHHVAVTLLASTTAAAIRIDLLAAPIAGDALVGAERVCHSSLPTRKLSPSLRVMNCRSSRI